MRGDYLKATLLQLLLLSQLAAFLAVLNFAREKEPLSNFETQIHLKKVGSAFENLPLEAALEMQKDNSVVFVDARENSLYLQEHVPKAISLPPKSQVDHSTRQLLERASQIVVYCAGKNCGASEIVAKELRALGLKNILILQDGWRGWQKQGYPVELGPQKLL